MLRRNKNNAQAAATGSAAEENKGDGPANGAPVVRRTGPAELRLRREFSEIDIPSHCTCEPDEKDPYTIHITIDLKNEDSLWKGGKYSFTLTVPPTYPHKAPKA